MQTGHQVFKIALHSKFKILASVISPFKLEAHTGCQVEDTEPTQAVTSSTLNFDHGKRCSHTISTVDQLMYMFAVFPLFAYYKPAHMKEQQIYERVQGLHTFQVNIPEIHVLQNFQSYPNSLFKYRLAVHILDLDSDSVFFISVTSVIYLSLSAQCRVAISDADWMKVHST